MPNLKNYFTTAAASLSSEVWTDSENSHQKCRNASSKTYASKNQQASVVANFGLVNGFDQAGLNCVPWYLRAGAIWSTLTIHLLMTLSTNRVECGMGLLHPINQFYSSNYLIQSPHRFLEVGRHLRLWCRLLLWKLKKFSCICSNPSGPSFLIWFVWNWCLKGFALCDTRGWLIVHVLVGCWSSRRCSSSVKDKKQL
jgi:hypothetical protein